MIELSADLGEAATDDERAIERAIWPMIDAANIACGGHAGDEPSMREAVVCASRLGVKVGAHPSYPDRANFGRKPVEIASSALEDSLVEQIASLRDVAAAHGVRLERVKAHGALYNEAHRDRARADVLLAALRAVDPSLALVAPEKSQMTEAAGAVDVRVIREAFADRRYLADGSLVPRSEGDALLSIEEAAAQADMLARERCVNARGERIRVEFDTICIHADMRGSVERLQAIRRTILPFVSIERT